MSQAGTVKRTKKITKFVLLSIVFVLLCGVSFYFIFKRSDQLPSEIREEINQASQLTNNGRLDEAVKLYDEIVGKVSDKSLKSNLLVEKALIYENNGAGYQAIKVLEEASSFRRSLAVVDMLARLYEEVDEDKAVGLYEEAIELIDKSSPLYPEEKAFYESKIRMISGDFSR